MLTGRAVVSLGPGVPLEVREYPVLPPEPDQVVVRIAMASICGSDLHMWRGEMPSLGAGAVVPGHEMVGRVHALGANWQTDSLGRPLREGDRITYSFFNPCGKCWACLSGTARCPNRYSRRAPADEPPHFHGAYADYHVVKPGQWVFKVPDSLPDELVAPVNCALAQVLYALHRIGVWVGDTVVIQGAGGLGLYACAIARVMGASQVIAVDRIPDRLALARAFGADATINLDQLRTRAERVQFVKERTEGRGADVALEVAGVPAVVQEGLEMLRFGGRYCLVGNIVPGAEGAIVPHDIVRTSREVLGVVGYEAWVIPRALDFLLRTRETYPFHRLVSHRYSLEEVNRAFQEAEWAQGQGRVTRAVLVP
ncbi:MAG: zinc-binding dehydrogenase [Chloroflexi bacterium]|nr:zinc-binding dehydrogenase [Chloroflexota bacterium]